MGGSDKGKEIIVRQWNCRSFKGKRGALAQEVAKLETKPHVITLQEIGKEEPKLTGYQTHWHQQGEKRTASLVANHITCREHSIENTNVEHGIIEIITDARKAPSIFIANIYSPPSNKKEVFHRYLEKAIKLSERRLLVVGDFNAPHPEWGYLQSAAKRRRLHEAINSLKLTNITDHNFPTRVGNRMQKDTTLDLACFNSWRRRQVD